ACGWPPPDPRGPGTSLERRPRRRGRRAGCAGTGSAPSARAAPPMPRTPPRRGARGSRPEAGRPASSRPPTGGRGAAAAKRPSGTSVPRGEGLLLTVVLLRVRGAHVFPAPGSLLLLVGVYRSVQFQVIPAVRGRFSTGSVMAENAV